LQVLGVKVDYSSGKLNCNSIRKWAKPQGIDFSGWVKRVDTLT